MTDPTGFSAIIQLVQNGGVLALLLIALVGGYRGWWVFGTYHQIIITQWKERLETETRELRAQRDLALKERDEWKTLAIKGTSLTERAVTSRTRSTAVVYRRGAGNSPQNG